MKPVLTLLVLGLVVSSTPSAEVWRRMIQGTPTWPSLARTRTAAIQTLALPPSSEVDSWAQRARDRSWLPRVDVRLGTRGDQDVRSLGTASESWTEGRDFGVDVSLRWGLAGLVFSEVEVRAHRERRARAVLLRRVVEEVTKVYLRRVEVELAPSTPDRVREGVRLDVVLDALTGGAWSTGDLLP